METKKRIDMIYNIGDNIISSLGFTTDENFHAVTQGISGVKPYDTGVFDLPEGFMASLINKEKLKDEFAKISSETNFTNLEKAAILSIFLANHKAQIDLSNEKTIFILSTTKGNIDLLNNAENQDFVSLRLGHTAEKITRFFQNKNTPTVISNACISGVAAQIAAMRAIQSERYDHAVVVGADLLSKFIISGFQSFKALSPVHCKPFDKNRCGLNLGEAAATIIFSRQKKITAQNVASLQYGAIRNDANHISAPSRTGEGSFRALNAVLQHLDIEQIAFINAHGTATPYNDAAEMNAIVRAGLQSVPINSLKAFFGHTLGAAGVLESIISMNALNENKILKSLNFQEQDFEYPLNIVQENLRCDKPYFIKMMSGFGGCNAVLAFARSTAQFSQTP